MKKKFITPEILVFHIQEKMPLMAGSVTVINNDYYEEDVQLSRDNSIWSNAKSPFDKIW